MLAELLHILNQCIVVVLAGWRGPVRDGFAAIGKVGEKVFCACPSGLVIIQTKDNVFYLRILAQERIQCDKIRAAQCQIVNAAPIFIVLHQPQ